MSNQNKTGYFGAISKRSTKGFGHFGGGGVVYDTPDKTDLAKLDDDELQAKTDPTQAADLAPSDDQVSGGPVKDQGAEDAKSQEPSTDAPSQPSLDQPPLNPNVEPDEASKTTDAPSQAAPNNEEGAEDENNEGQPGDDSEKDSQPTLQPNELSYEEVNALSWGELQSYASERIAMGPKMKKAEIIKALFPNHEEDAK